MDARSITDSDTPVAAHFLLPPSLSMATVETVASEIAQISFKPEQSLMLDGSAVEQISTPGIQLILSLAKTRTRDDGALHLLQPSQTLNDAFAQLGLAAELQALGA